MPKARTIRGRVEQCRQWLEEHYPPAFPVTVRWQKYCAGFGKSDIGQVTKREWDYGIHGWCEKHGSRFVIALSSRRLRTRQDACEILMHEWSHALSEKFAKLERRRLSVHDDEFFLTWGRIHRAWNEKGGAEAADKYEF
ncbi:MAG: hypothetical protein V3S71_07480 [Acidobacteriota bacterium]